MVTPRCGHGIDKGTTIKLSRMQMYQLALAMEGFREKFGTYPTGDTAAVLRALRGTNSEKMVFLSVSSNSVDSAGRLLDPWGTPFEIVVTSTNRVLIRCAGKNKRFGDEDDETNSQ
jgi:hypothetical protein